MLLGWVVSVLLVTVLFSLAADDTYLGEAIATFVCFCDLFVGGKVVR